MEHLQGCDQPSVLLTHPRSLWSGWVLHTRKIPPCHSSSKHSILPTTSPVAYKPHPVGFLRAGTHPCQGCRMTHTAFDVITCPCSPACAGAQEPYGPCPLAAFTKHIGGHLLTRLVTRPARSGVSATRLVPRRYLFPKSMVSFSLTNS